VRWCDEEKLADASNGPPGVLAVKVTREIIVALKGPIVRVLSHLDPWNTASDHLIEEASNEGERIDDIVVSPCRETE
jgi:hypothetical protein